MAPSPIGCQVLLCADAAGFWLAWPSHESAGCRTLRGPGASAGSLVGGVKVQKTPGLFLPHCWVKPGSGVSVGLLVGRAISWGLAIGPRDRSLLSKFGICCIVYPSIGS